VTDARGGTREFEFAVGAVSLYLDLLAVVMCSGVDPRQAAAAPVFPVLVVIVIQRYERDLDFEMGGRVNLGVLSVSIDDEFVGANGLSIEEYPEMPPLEVGVICGLRRLAC
jgi:hypothetical protein